jgi:hypothetical protein
MAGPAREAQDEHDHTVHFLVPERRSVLGLITRRLPYMPPYARRARAVAIGGEPACVLRLACVQPEGWCARARGV